MCLLEAQPIQQIQHIAQAITDSQTCDESILMSNCVYIKNFGNTLIKEAKS
jgi:hypothetical protein